MPMDDDCDHDRALTRAASGDDGAFATVVERLHWPLRLWLAARCPPEIDPDEIAHLAFVHAHAILDEYQPGSSPRAWLWTIARNQLRAQVTSLRRRQANQAHYLPEAVRAAQEKAVEDAPRADENEVAALRACVARLPARTQELLTAHYSDDLPLQALAERWARTVGAVKKQLCLVRKALRQCINERLAASHV